MTYEAEADRARPRLAQDSRRVNYKRGGHGAQHYESPEEDRGAPEIRTRNFNNIQNKPERGKIRRLSAGGLGGNQMANKYRVKVSYISFMFEDRNEAIDFAETAFDKMVDENRGVEISIVRADEEVEA